MSQKDMNLMDPTLHENRELSWLSFNQRVLDEAMNNENPLLERVKFLSIVSSNMDEFFMVRVASLKEQVNAAYEKADVSGLTAKEQLSVISGRAHQMVEDQFNHYRRSLLPLLKKQGLHILDGKDLTENQRQFVQEYFEDVMYPVLTPMAVDASRPFPLIQNKSVNVAVLLEKDGDISFATVQVPSVLQRYVPIPCENSDEKAFVLLGEIIQLFVEKLFIGYQVVSTAYYRITRNGDLSIDEEEASDLLLEIEKSLKKRRWGQPIRLEVSDDIDDRLFAVLKDALGIHKKDVYYINGPLDLTFLMKFCFIKGYDHLRYERFTPARAKDLLGVEDLFQTISQKDVFLYHPFESFDPIVELVQAAAKDKDVLAIKQTLYRVSGESPIVRALAEAADRGKQVTVLVELKARFDEENNIAWARRLEKAGCHVIYGLVGLKTHSKVTLIVRSEEEGIRRYVHLGTGNYNDSTAKLYTDMGLLTCNEQIGADVSAIFNTITGYSEPPKLHKLTMAPTGLRKRFYDMIDREIAYCQNGQEGKIVAKMNSLCDPGIVEKLYEASRAGVKVDLIVRGICSLIPQIPDVSENIHVISIVGRYLEHSRVYSFLNGGNQEIYLSSADWMPRNLNRRIELLFPIEDPMIKERINRIMDQQLGDVVKGKVKDANKEYHRIDRRGKEVVHSQELAEQEATMAEVSYTRDEVEDVFRPVGGI